MNKFISTFSYKLIYIFRINDKNHNGLLKIGEATCTTDKTPDELFPNCKELNASAKARINQYTTTAGVEYELLHTELAIRTIVKSGKQKIEAFSDHQVHSVLLRSDIKKHIFDTQNKANEWFRTDLETAKRAINAVKANRASLYANEITEDRNPIVFRPEQLKAIKDTKSQFKVGNQMLWNAKMRFGKTLTALQVAKEMEFGKTIILTHRPVVNKGWFEDFQKIFYDTNYVYGSKTNGEKIENLIDTDKKFVYFASMQDLRGSQAVGGKFDKNDEIFLIEWDYVVIDEAHEGTLTKLGQAVIDELCNQTKQPKILRLSGTPFNLLDQFKESEIYTWDYVMEQREKKMWDKLHLGDSNPYSSLPELQIYTYDLNKLIGGYFDDEDHAFNFREFFRTWTGVMEKDFKPIPAGAKVGDFVHKDDVNAFLDLMCKSDKNSNYPFSNEEYRNYFRHSLWMVPGVKEAKALSALLQKHPVFGSGAFKIVNVAGEGDEEVDSKDALKAVQNAFGPNPAETYTITISCGRLTTGVSVPEWTAVFMLAGTFSTAASAYLQTIFRVQTPANINGKIKEYCCVFDFAPDRTLKMVAEAGKLSAKSGDTSSDRTIMGEFLNFCPVIGIEGSRMSEYNVDSLLQQLKKAYTDRVVKNGFDDKHIYNDNLLKLNDIELKDFESLKKIVGASKQTQKQGDIDINKQGLTKEEYERIKALEKKPKKELTEEDKARLEALKEKKKNRDTAISILRGISIRIPLLVYGANVPDNVEITTENFTTLIDDISWEEFMPKGVTKDVFKKFAKYYEQDVFISAGRQIRNKAKSADNLTPTERVKRIVEIFNTFKNPDKETVLTPWRVVNMHLGDCLGGYDFYDENHEELLDEPRYRDNGKVTNETLSNPNAKILEINSKSGLYPLYVVYSIYRKRCSMINPNELTKEKQFELWDKTVEENIFVICKTPMARAITKRTLLGYRKAKINAHAFDDLNMQLKDKPEQFREKISRGNFWNKEVKEMKFDAIVGNPPYQEMISNGENKALAKQLFPYFIQESIKLNPSYVSLITPSRWFTGEAQDKSFIKLRDFVRNEQHFKTIISYPNNEDVFSNVLIRGGVNYFLWQKSYQGNVTFVEVIGDNKKSQIRPLFEDGLDIVIDNSNTIPILHKVTDNNFTSLMTITKGRNAFGIVGRKDIVQSISITTQTDGYYKLRCMNNEIRYVKEKDITKSIDVFKSWKIFISKSAGGPEDMKVLSKPFIAEPYTCCTDTFIPIGSFKTEIEAKNLSKYIHTKFVRYMVSILKVSQNVYQNVYQFVPIQDFTDNSDINWSKSIPEIDQQLYNKYNLSTEEIDFIETTIKPME